MPEQDASTDPTTYFVPKMGEFAVTNTAFYSSLYLTDFGAARKTQSLASRIDPFADLPEDDEQASLPAVGVLLTHEQGWFQQGLALGELLHSLCLAPGEVTKVAVVDWKRREQAQDQTATDQSETVSAESEQNLATSEIQRAQARERQTGQSTTANVATQSNMGGNAGFLFGGVSGSSSLATSLGHSTSISTGSRNLTAESNREVNQRSEQLSQATRSRRSTSIREVSQSETQNVSTRVVANYNRQHAMTVQYYEVLQVYELRTRVAKAERCLFVPMEVLEFDIATIKKFRETLLAIATDLGLEDLRVILLEVVDKQSEQRAELTSAKRREDDALDRLKNITETRNAHARAQPAPPQFRGNIVEFSREMAEFPKAMVAWANRARQLDREIGQAVSAHARAVATTAQLRVGIGVTEARLVEFFKRDRLVLNQLMWMRLDAHRVHRLLSGFDYEGQRLGGLIDPKPVGVFGNYVAFRWHFEKEAERKKFTQQFEQEDRDAATARVVLPSEGVFAEAVLGQSNAAEKIDVTRFWDWNASPIPILPPDFADVEVTSRARDVETGDAALAPSLASLQALQALPGSDLGAILGALQKGDIFRNMSGIEQTAAIAAKLADNTEKGSAAAAQTALEAQKAYADTLVKLANSEAGKAAMQLALTAVPGGKAATVLGGLMNAAGGGSDPEAGETSSGDTASGVVNSAASAVSKASPGRRGRGRTGG